MSTDRRSVWLAAAALIGFVASAAILGYQGSRPGATIWTLLNPGSLCAGAVMVGCGVVIVTLSGRSGLWSGALALPVVVMLTGLLLGQSVAARVFERQFASFAHASLHHGLPTGENFRIGPFTYDEGCVAGGDVYVWQSGDDFMSVSAIRIERDGSVRDVTLREGSDLFACANTRSG